MKLVRTKQCKHCPWKVSTNPHDIPDGYCSTKHANLAQTIAEPGVIMVGGETHVMACHHSNGADSMYCVGWLHHQLGVGNNIGLRLQMMHCENAREIEVYGKQHERFKDTLPSN